MTDINNHVAAAGNLHNIQDKAAIYDICAMCDVRVTAIKTERT